MKELNEREKKMLRDFVKKELKDNYDLFDVESHIDNTLNYEENKNYLGEVVRQFKEDMKERVDNVKKGGFEEQEKDFFEKWMDENQFEIEKIGGLLDKPKIIGVIADKNSGKSNLFYYILSILEKKYKFNLYSFGLKYDFGEIKIYSLFELERVRNSLIFIDEFFTLFDLDDRKNKSMIERTLRLINHNNNIVLLGGLPENYKKFISNKLDIKIYGRCTIGDFINGSNVKKTCMNYKGSELGSNMLELTPDKFIIFDGEHYTKANIPYLSKYDSKKENTPIIKEKCVENLEEKEENSEEDSNDSE